MSRTVDTDTTDQSIRFWAYDSSGAAVTGEAYNSSGMAISVIVRRKGRVVSTTSLTLIARAVSGTHEDSALTEVGSGEYVVDLADSYFTTAGNTVSLSVASDAITGSVVVETLTVQTPVDNASISNILDTASYSLTILAGTISNAGEATETFTLTVNGLDYTAQIAGLDTDGNRSGQTLSKA